MQGGVLDDLADIENHIVELNFDDLFQDVHVPSLSREDSDWLMRSFIEEEVIIALKSMFHIIQWNILQAPFYFSLMKINNEAQNVFL